MSHRQIKEMVDRAEQQFNQLERLADQLQAATVEPRQFEQVEQMCSQLAQQMEQIRQYAQQGRQGQ